MCDSLSPSGSDLIIDDEEFDIVSLTKEDLSEAEAKCGLAAGGRVIARPGLVCHSEKSTPPPESIFKFGGVANVFPNIFRLEPETLTAIISLLVPSMKHILEIRFFDKLLHRLGCHILVFRPFV